MSIKTKKINMSNSFRVPKKTKISIYHVDSESTIEFDHFDLDASELIDSFCRLLVAAGFSESTVYSAIDQISEERNFRKEIDDEELHD